MAKRVKPDVTVVQTAKQAEAAMMELARLGRDIKIVDIDTANAIDSLKKLGKDKKEPLLAHKKELENALCTYATLNKSDLFKKRKSLETPFGVFGWRKATKLLTIAKMTLADVLGRLHELGITDAIRTKEAVDKTAMADWPDSRLETVGMRRVTNDEFFIETHDLEEE